jgi:hypothetical protein
MSATKCRWCWRKDLSEFRGLTARERTGSLLVLEWFENFRLRSELPAGREAARTFWRSEVLREDRPREEWQLEQWGDAIIWHLKWLEACAEAGGDHRSLPERLEARRSLARPPVHPAPNITRACSVPRDDGWFSELREQQQEERAHRERHGPECQRV